MSLRDIVMRPPQAVEVEAFGKTVIVSEIGAMDRIEYIEYLQKLQNDDISDERAGVLLSLFLMVKSVVEDGQRVFADDDMYKLERSNIDLTEVAKVFNASAKLNKLLGEEGN